MLATLPPRERQIVDILYEQGPSVVGEILDALGQVVKVFFNGSPVGAVSALLGMQDGLENAELDELERLIAEARKGKAL